MGAVESGRRKDFLEVLEETGNTVCGRHPIGVFMAAVEALEAQQDKQGENYGLAGRRRMRFVRYERSGEVTSVKESSVSYASAFAVL